MERCKIGGKFHRNSTGKIPREFPGNPAEVLLVLDGLNVPLEDWLAF